MFIVGVLAIAATLQSCLPFLQINSYRLGDRMAHRNPSHDMECEPESMIQVEDTTIWTESHREVFFFSCGMAIDADGAPDAYHRDNLGTDYLANAGKPGNWWGIATNTGKPSGEPFIQGKNDPHPGFYVSQTSLFDRTKKRNNPERYVNANEIPYIMLSRDRAWGAKLGDYAIVVNSKNGQQSPAIVAEIGAKNRIGEGSIALAKSLDINASPRVGGVEDGIVYLVFPGSGSGFPESKEIVESTARALFSDWGGLQRLMDCMPEFFEIG